MARNPKTLKPRNAERKALSESVAEFDKLLRFVVNFQGRFALAFICGEDRRRRDGVLASLADLLKEEQVSLRHIDLTFREATDLLATLKKECRQTENAAIVVTGIEASLNGNFIASLNVQRDLISQQIKCPLLFWVSSFALNLLAREAPDFYGFRQTVFNFSSSRTNNETAGSRDPSAQRSVPFESSPESSRGRTGDLLRQLEKYQKDEESLGARERLAYAELLEEIGRSYRNQRHRTEAIPYLQKALSIYTAVRELPRQAAVLRALRDTYYYSDNQPRAAEHFIAALTLHREIGDRLGEANALKSLGDVKGAQSDNAEAERLYPQALPIHREIGDRLGEANALKSLGDVKRVQSDYAQAEEFLTKAMRIFATIDDKYSQGTTLLSLARLHRASGSKQKAEQSARRAMGFLAAFPNLVEACDKIIRDLS